MYLNDEMTNNRARLRTITQMYLNQAKLIKESMDSVVQL